MSVERVLIGGAIYTADTDRPTATALAIEQGRIVAVGSDAEVRALATADTEVVELSGRFVMPGFIDAHNHYHLQGQTELFETVLPGTLDLQGILDAVDEHTSAAAEGEWVVLSPFGAHIGDELASAATLARLDEVSHGHPVMVREYSRHNRWVNSEALRRAGVTAETPDPPHGEIVRDGGAATGLLIESAGIPVEHAFRADRGFRHDESRAAVERGIRILSGFGVTAFQDGAASVAAMEGAAALDRAGELTAWVVSSLPVNEQIFGFLPAGEAVLDCSEPTRTEHHRPDFVKIFMDGVPPARTSVFIDPYLPDASIGDDYRAETLLTGDEFVDLLERVAERGLGAKIHCTGDGSVRAALDGIARVREGGYTEQTYQIAHAQFVHPDDLGRFADLDVVCEISPYFWVPGPVPTAIGQVMGDEVISRMHPNRELVDHGALVAVGSDWPCSDTPNPWLAIHGLVTRTDPTGAFAGALNRDQAVTVDEAIRMATINGAHAIGLADETGSLSPGKSADFIVTDANPFDVAPERLKDITVTQTWFNGRQVHG